MKATEISFGVKPRVQSGVTGSIGDPMKDAAFAALPPVHFSADSLQKSSVQKPLVTYPIQKRTIMNRWLFPSDIGSILGMFPSASDLSAVSSAWKPLSAIGFDIDQEQAVPDRESFRALLKEKDATGASAPLFARIVEEFAVESREDICFLYRVLKNSDPEQLKTLDAVAQNFLRYDFFHSYREAFEVVRTMLEDTSSLNTKTGLLRLPETLQTYRGDFLDSRSFGTLKQEAIRLYLRGLPNQASLGKTGDKEAEAKPFTSLSFDNYMTQVFQAVSQIGELLHDPASTPNHLRLNAAYQQIPLRLFQIASAQSENFETLKAKLESMRTFFEAGHKRPVKNMTRNEAVRLFLNVRDPKRQAIILGQMENLSRSLDPKQILPFMLWAEARWLGSPEDFSAFLSQMDKDCRDVFGTNPAKMYAAYRSAFTRLGSFPVQNPLSGITHISNLYAAMDGLQDEDKQKRLVSVISMFSNWSAFNDYFDQLALQAKGDTHVLKSMMRALLLSGNKAEEALSVGKLLNSFQELKLPPGDIARLSKLASSTLESYDGPKFQKIWKYLLFDVKKGQNLSLVDTMETLAKIVPQQENLADFMILSLQIPRDQRKEVLQKLVANKFSIARLYKSNPSAQTGFDLKNFKPLWRICVQEVNRSKSSQVFDIAGRLQEVFTQPSSYLKALQMLLEIPHEQQPEVVLAFVKYATPLSEMLIGKDSPERLIANREFLQLWSDWKAVIEKTGQADIVEHFGKLSFRCDNVSELKQLAACVMKFPSNTRKRILNILSLDEMVPRTRRNRKTSFWETKSMENRLSVLDTMRSDLEKFNDQDYLEYFEKFSMNLTSFELVKAITEIFMSLPKDHRTTSFDVVARQLPALTKLIPLNPNSEKEYQANIEKFTRNVEFLSLLREPTKLLNFYMLHRNDILAETVSSVYYAIEYNLDIPTGKNILPELLAIIQPYWESLKNNPKRNEFINQVSTGITRLYNLVRTAGQIEPIVLMNWVKMGTLGLSFTKWQFDAMNRWKGLGPMQKPSLFEVSGMFKKTPPRSNDSRYHGGFHMYNANSKLSVELRRAYIVVSKPALGSLVIRNSSHFFGRDLLPDAAYYLPDKVYTTGTNLFNPDTDIELPQNALNDSPQCAFAAGINAPQDQKKNHNKIEKLLEEFEQAMEPYVAWKCGFKKGVPPEGFKEFLQTALWSVKNQGAMTPFGKHKNLRLVWVDRFGLPFVAKAFELTKPENLSELEFYLDVLNRKTAVTSQEDYNAKVPNLLKFIGEGMQKGYELVLKSE